MEMILKVDDRQASFLLELLQKFDFVQIEPLPSGTVSNLSLEDKTELDERMQKCEDPQNLIHWEEFTKEVHQTFGF